MPQYFGAGSWKGLEYNMIPEGGAYPDPGEGPAPVFQHGSPEPLYWSGVEIECPDRTILTGYRVEVKYFELTIDEIPPPTDEDGNPIGEPTYNSTLTYPTWNLNRQTLFRAQEKCYFERELGNNLFSTPPDTPNLGVAVSGISDEIYGPPKPPSPPLDLEDPNLDPELLQIPDVNAYSYCRIFDQADIEWIPRLSAPDQEVLNGKRTPIPGEPYDPESNPPVFPFDAITSFVPDPRDSVTLTYDLTTNYTTIHGTFEETVTINHVVSQSSLDVSEKLLLFMNKSYYGNNYIHTGLYPPESPNVYNKQGRVLWKEDQGANQPVRYPSGGRIPMINEPTSMIQLTRRTYPYDERIQDWRPYPEEQCR